MFELLAHLKLHYTDNVTLYHNIIKSRLDHQRIETYNNEFRRDCSSLINQRGRFLFLNLKRGTNADTGKYTVRLVDIVPFLRGGVSRRCQQKSASKLALK